MGRLCTPLDVLGEDVDLADAEVGDLVVVFQAGAYVCSASAVNLLGSADSDRGPDLRSEGSPAGRRTLGCGVPARERASPIGGKRGCLPLRGVSH